MVELISNMIRFKDLSRLWWIDTKIESNHEEGHE